MREHFKSEHFLCEEDECVDEEFTAVFRSEIDLKAHKVTVHSKTMTRAEVRQARTLEIDFSYGPRGRGGGENFRGRIRTNDTQREFDRVPEQNQHYQQQQYQEPINIDANNEEQFPSLAGPSAPQQAVQLANSVRHVVYKQSGLAKTSENFPALGGVGSGKASGKQQQQHVNKQVKQPTSNSKPTASSLFKASASKQASEKFHDSTMNKFKKTKDPVNDFPALPVNFKKNASHNLMEDMVVPMNKLKKTKDPITDFPVLKVNSKKKASHDLMEDMVVPSNDNAIDKSLISSKHRGLLNEYVSIAAQMTKVQLVKQKEAEIIADDNVQKSVPKLNSVNNFPSLGGGSSSGSNINNYQSNSKVPSWITVKPNGNQKQPPLKSENNKNQMVNLNKAVKKNNDIVPQKNQKFNANFNGLKKDGSADKKLNSENKEKALKTPPGFEKMKNFSRFKPVPEMSKRNQALVEEFEKVLKTNEAMQEFRLLSQMFRDGNYFARSYYESCKHVLGEKFDTLFPELIALLPDIEKQQVS
jgi:E3 ubiquitin-protein ligase ZNF598